MSIATLSLLLYSIFASLQVAKFFARSTDLYIDPLMQYNRRTRRIRRDIMRLRRSVSPVPGVIGPSVSSILRISNSSTFQISLDSNGSSTCTSFELPESPLYFNRSSDSGPT